MSQAPGELAFAVDIEPAKRHVIPLRSGKLLYMSKPSGKDKEFVDAGGYLTVLEESFPDGVGRREVLRLPLLGTSLKKIDENRCIVFFEHELNRPDLESMEAEERRESLALLQEEQRVIVCDELPFCADGRGYISGKRRGICICDRTSGDFHVLTPRNFDAGAVAVYGELIAFSGTPHNGIRDLSDGLYLFDMALGTTATLATPGKFHIKGIAFVGGKLIVAANPWEGFSSRYGHSLYFFDLNHPEEPVLCADLSGEDIGFNVASDCSFGGGTIFASEDATLYFVSTLKNTSVLTSWNEVEGLKRLTPTDFVAEFFALSGNGIAVYGSMEGELPELYLLRTNGDLHRLTSMNVSYSDSHAVSKPRAITLKNREGVFIDGWIINPIDYDENRKYPALLEIHGGPRLIYSFGFFHEMQVMASRGFFVFFCNPRGSSGKGNGFADLRGVRGTIDYNDIMDFTMGILRLYPQIDEKRLATIGGSYGGFMVNWIIGHTDVFAVAVSCRSNSNIIGNYGVSDNGIWSLEGSYGGNIWKDHELIWQQSPLKYAENARTPTLFLHSLEDYSCRFPNSMQMFVALRTHGVDSKMVLFKDECHSLSRTGRPKNRRRRLRELCAWIERYTAGKKRI